MKSLKIIGAVAVSAACAACVSIGMPGNAGSVRIRFDMPEDGKATLVLDGPDGRRVRNLVNGIAFAKGRHVVEWDGRAEDGTGAERIS